MRSFLFLAGTALLAGCASTERQAAYDAKQAAAVPAASPIGAPKDCVLLRDIDHTKVQSDRVVDFVMRNGEVYRNTLPNSCPTLGFNEKFSYRTTGSQLCSIDTITVFDNSGVRGASCGLGSFQQVEPAAGH
jgi:uncharacterized protein DUF6491